MTISKLNANQLLLNATKAHDYTEVKYALDQNADVNNETFCSAVETERIDIVELFLSRGAKVNQWTTNRYPLLSAIQVRNIQMVKKLLIEKACVTTQELYSAVVVGNEEIIKILVQGNESLFATTLQKNPNIFFEVVQKVNIKILKYLHQFEKNINIQQIYQGTPLFTAIEFKHIEMVQALIELRADVNVIASPFVYKGSIDNSGWTPLRLAVRTNQIEIVKLLLAHGATLNTCVLSDAKNSSEITRLLVRNGLTAKDYTPLHVAAGDGNLNTLRTLLERSEFPIDAKSSDFGTPLCEAVRNGQHKAARLLISHGADVNFTTRDGSPLLIAVKAKQYAAAKLLLSKGANVNHTSSSKLYYEEIESPLQVAASQGSVEIVRLLLEYKADVSLGKGGDFHFPLCEAAYHGHLEIMKILLQHGANVNQKSHFHSQDTALHFACGVFGSNSADVVHLLLDNGANINARNGLQETPLYLAATYGKDRVARALLREQGSISKVTEHGQVKISHQSVDLYAKTDGKTAFDKAKGLALEKWRQSAKRKIYEMLRAKEALPKIYDSEFQNLFKRIIEVGLDGLKDHELCLLYTDRERSIPIGKFVREFEAEIKKANKLFLYARSGNSYFQRALRSAGLPAEMAAHVASFVSTEHLPYDRSGKSWFNKIQGI